MTLRQRLGCYGSLGPGCLAAAVLALGGAWLVGRWAYRRAQGNLALLATARAAGRDAVVAELRRAGVRD